MGRTGKSQGLAPPAIRKDMRAKQARHIVNKVIPGILASNARARRGAEGSELIVDPGHGYAQGEETKQETSKAGKQKDSSEPKYLKRKGQGRRKAQNDALSNDSSPRAPPAAKKPQHYLERAPLKIRVLATDTLTAAHALTRPRSRTTPNPCILNMASPLRPGGGLLAGATSQEEFLCARTTLLPSLKDTFYRLPERGAIFTRDVLVFRTHLPLDDPRGEIPSTARWWVDVVSAGMLRFPDLEGGEEEKRLGGKDRAAVEGKMRAVLRIAVGAGARRVVLGAWGCGAYGNPVVDVAEAWRAVLVPEVAEGGVSPPGRGKAGRKVEMWEGLEEVVFAIGSMKMAREFARAFGGVEVEEGPESHEGEEGDETDEVAEELRAKIAEMEGQVDKVWNAELKQRMSVILEGLRVQLREREGGRGVSGEEEEGSGDEEEEESSEDGRISDAGEASDVGLGEVVHYSSDEWQASRATLDGQSYRVMHVLILEHERNM
ncbi:hypothetical protein P171DRAFT_477020 [Karstenula rhodostoma CBS 690.94]|uniref:Microbial-type PARG catalytic domain-containing protein n=1 Tax=Karstenula rhodostoma CBS 690.94 TaxID=1392251 RepID=A0A9P4P6F9_9PLEO|nr:hypothetical protein P171DRAFT_477020 [Karstenula rhodostoma CBS 690.94]